MKPIMQAGYVVDDLDKAVRHWVEVLGVGPFLVLRNMRYDEYRYQGERGDIDISVAFAASGDLQIELIQQHCATPSLYRPGHPAVRAGVHHLGILTDDLEADEARLLAGGMLCEQSAVSTASGTSVRYYSGGPAGLIELISMKNGAEFAEFLRDKARQWDGVSPYITFEEQN